MMKRFVEDDIGKTARGTVCNKLLSDQRVVAGLKPLNGLVPSEQILRLRLV